MQALSSPQSLVIPQQVFSPTSTLPASQDIHLCLDPQVRSSQERVLAGYTGAGLVTSSHHTNLPAEQFNTLKAFKSWTTKVTFPPITTYIAVSLQHLYFYTHNVSIKISSNPFPHMGLFRPRTLYPKKSAVI